MNKEEDLASTINHHKRKKRILLFIISLGKGKRTSTLRKPDFASCFPFSSCRASRNWWKTPERKGDNTLVPTQSKTPLLTIPRYILECRPKLQEKPPNQTHCSHLQLKHWHVIFIQNSLPSQHTAHSWAQYVHISRPPRLWAAVQPHQCPCTSSTTPAAGYSFTSRGLLDSVTRPRKSEQRFNYLLI